MNCPKCNRPVAATSKFCNHCGQSLKSLTTQAAPPQPVDALIGRQFGTYRIARLLGKGGFAKVYLGEHVHLERQAAIKLLNTQLASPEDIEQFRNEARTIAGLAHPHIVRILDFDVADDIPFLVLDYAPNGSLRSLYPKGTVLELGTILLYVKQVAEALQYAHSKKLVHRDIKPENMLLNQSNDVLLTDFGIAVVAPTSTYVDTKVVGTIAYMAPEQVQGEQRTTSDLYSLGIVLYEWLCGEPPFHGTFQEIAVQHMNKLPPPLRDKVPGIPPAVEEVVMTALAKDPKFRFASAQALAVAFEQAVQGHGTSGAIAPGSSSPELLYLPTRHLSGPASGQAAPLAPQPGAAANPTVPTSLPAGWLDHPTKKIAGPPQSMPLPLHAVAPPPIPVSPVTGGDLFPAPNPAPGTTGEMPEPPDEPPEPGTSIYFLPRLSTAIEALVWVNQGTQIVLNSADNIIRVWESETGRFSSSFAGQRILVSPTQERAAILSNDQSVHIVDLRTSREVLAYQDHQSAVTALAWSPDGQRIASGAQDNEVLIWDAISGKTRKSYRLLTGPVSVVAWSPDGKHVASADSDGKVRVQTPPNTTTTPPYAGHAEKVTHLFWSPDSRRLISASQDGAIYIWDALNPRNRTSSVAIQMKNRSPVAQSPDGAYIASVSVDQDGKTKVQVWESMTGQIRKQYAGHADTVRVISWSPDGRRIASAGKDGNVHVWDASTGKRQFIYDEHKGELRAIAWSPDGNRLAAAGQEKNVHIIWSAEPESLPSNSAFSLRSDQLGLLVIAGVILVFSAILALVTSAGWVFIAGLLISIATALYALVKPPTSGEARQSDAS